MEDEDHLERAVQTVTAARRDRLAFLNHIGHEFRTPLTAIIGFVDILSQRAETDGAVIDDTMREYLAHVCDSGGDMLALVKDLMLLAHSDSLSATVLRPCASAEPVSDCYGSCSNPCRARCQGSNNAVLRLGVCAVIMIWLAKAQAR